MDRKTTKVFIVGFFLLHILLGLVLIYLILGPELLYNFNTLDEDEIVEIYDDLDKEEIKDEKLIIPSIGVDMKIGIEPYFLDFGGWVQRQNNENMPQVIAIHRFGWDTLSPQEKIKQTLYHVNKLQEGNKVIILWNKEKFEYTIVRIEEGTNNPSLKDNQLILYTCEFWNSPYRVFVVLERI